MGVFMAWFLAAGIQTVRDIRSHRVPVPSEYVASGAWFGLWAVIGSGSEGAAKFAGLVSWGTLIAITLQAGGPKGLVDQGVPGPVGGWATPTPPNTAQQQAAKPGSFSQVTSGGQILGPPGGKF